MGAKASIHMQPMKAMNASLSDENERRDKSKEWFDRTKDSKGTPYHYDWWRRNLNFEIVKGKICPQLSHAIPLHERLQNRLRELGFKNYKVTAKNAPNVCMDFVIGGQRERLREMAFGNQVVNFESSDEKNSSVVRQKEIENWALDTYRWAVNRYREENIIGFNVHLDETTPHIHMQVVPVAEKKRRGRVKTGQERGTVKTVSYAGIVGETPEALAKYLDDMHTDYHLQVGYKYGLERGTFFDDLTPEEQALRPKGNRSKAEYIIVEKIRDEINKLQNMKEELNREVSALRDQVQLLEKKQKAFTTMLYNLNEQKEYLEIEITALEEMRDNGNEEVEQQLREKREQLDDIILKISDRKGQLSNVQQQLHDLAIRKHDLQKEYDNMKRQINKELPDLLDKTQSEVNDTFWEMAAAEMKKDYSAINEYISKNLDTKQQGELREIIGTSFFEDLAQRGEQMAACAAALFLGFVDAATNIAHAGGGGGGDTSGWGRNKDEDDEAYRRRCCIMGRMMMKPAGRKLQRGRSF